VIEDGPLEFGGDLLIVRDFDENFCWKSSLLQSGTAGAAK
jgi:hypothetical protein